MNTPVRRSPFTLAFREFVRQAEKLTKPGVVATWRSWAESAESDDPPNVNQGTWVRFTPDTLDGGRAATEADDETYLGEYRMGVAVEMEVAGHSPDALWDAWGEVRHAIFSQADTVRLARDAAFVAVGVADVIEDQPVSPRGDADFATGIVAGTGRVTLVIHTGV